MDISQSWDGNHGTLSVFVSKAKDMPNLIKLDKQNVMLRLRIAHMTRESDVLFRAGQNPIFNYLERFEMTPAVKPIMFVEAYCERKKKPPLLIGRCEIDLLNGIRADPSEGYCKWYELKREQDEFAGIIFIELTFQPKIDTSSRKRIDRSTARLDASMASRPIPPLPTELGEQPSSHMSNEYSHGSGDFRGYDNPLNSRPAQSQHYMHASALRQMTPSLHRLNLNDEYQDIESNGTFSPGASTGSSGLHQNFMSSMGSSNTAMSSESKETTVSSSSETKFHFANLMKLKEKINIFKNPTIPTTTETESNTVDIDALQKAIGVTSDEGDDSDLETESYPSNSRKSSAVPGQHRLPTTTSHEQSPGRNRSPHAGHTDNREGRRSPTRMGQQPNLPPLPNSVHSSPRKHRSNSSSPKHRNYYSPSGAHSPELPPLPTSAGSFHSPRSPAHRRPPPS